MSQSPDPTYENSALRGLLDTFAHPARDSSVVLRSYHLGSADEGFGAVVTINFGRYDWYVSLERNPVNGGWQAVFEPSFTESVFEQAALSRLATDIGLIDALCLHLAEGEAGE